MSVYVIYNVYPRNIYQVFRESQKKTHETQFSWSTRFHWLEGWSWHLSCGWGGFVAVPKCAGHPSWQRTVWSFGRETQNTTGSIFLAVRWSCLLLIVAERQSYRKGVLLSLSCRQYSWRAHRYQRNPKDQIWSNMAIWPPIQNSERQELLRMTNDDNLVQVKFKILPKPCPPQFQDPQTSYPDSFDCNTRQSQSGLRKRPYSFPPRRMHHWCPKTAKRHERLTAETCSETMLGVDLNWLHMCLLCSSNFIIFHLCSIFVHIQLLWLQLTCHLLVIVGFSELTTLLAAAFALIPAARNVRKPSWSERRGANLGS